MQKKENEVHAKNLEEYNEGLKKQSEADKERSADIRASPPLLSNKNRAFLSDSSPKYAEKGESEESADISGYRVQKAKLKKLREKERAERYLV